jgi:hypothetical protein
MLHYHPDKQYLEEDGLKWIVMSEEITNNKDSKVSLVKNNIVSDDLLQQTVVFVYIRDDIKDH